MEKKYLTFIVVLGFLSSCQVEHPNKAIADSDGTEVSVDRLNEQDFTEQVMTEADNSTLSLTQTSTDTQQKMPDTNTVTQTNAQVTEHNVIIPDFYIEEIQPATINFYGCTSISGGINLIPFYSKFDNNENYEDFDLFEQNTPNEVRIVVSRGELTEELLEQYPELENEEYSYIWSFNGQIISQSNTLENPAPENAKNIVEYMVTDQYGVQLHGEYVFYNDYNKWLGLDAKLNKDFMFIESSINLPEHEFENFEFTWSTGDGHTYETLNFEHQYKHVGEYLLELKAENLITNERVEYSYSLTYQEDLSIALDSKLEQEENNINIKSNIIGLIDDLPVSVYTAPYEERSLGSVLISGINISGLPDEYVFIKDEYSCENDSDNVYRVINRADPDKLAFEYEIDFGDGSEIHIGQTNELVFNHQYDNGGSYIVTLKVKDLHSKLTAIEYIQVNIPLQEIEILPVDLSEIELTEGIVVPVQ